ncbi:hypothetical protein GCM10009850_023720 [Nonomuraea monospora]|uniref:Uncharacterized protein n=1 Tax=Nonomuraea monospora TaxID=568818 RepID=A0ABP5P5B8_9ACTN
MKVRTRTRRAAAAAAALGAVLVLNPAPAQAGASDPCKAATVVRTPQFSGVLADGESGAKRPV